MECEEEEDEEQEQEQEQEEEDDVHFVKFFFACITHIMIFS